MENDNFNPGGYGADGWGWLRCCSDRQRQCFGGFFELPLQRVDHDLQPGIMFKRAITGQLRQLPLYDPVIKTTINWNLKIRMGPKTSSLFFILLDYLSI
jgi:hypothetical protein